MAKRDKLYTVNKWNKPFFEDDRRKRLYALGDRIIYGLKEGLGAERNSYAFTGGVDANINMPSYLLKAFTSFNKHANPGRYHDMIKTHITDPRVNVPGPSFNTITSTASDQKDLNTSKSKKGFSLSLQDFDFSNATKAITNAAAKSNVTGYTPTSLNLNTELTLPAALRFHLAVPELKTSLPQMPNIYGNDFYGRMRYLLANKSNEIANFFQNYKPLDDVLIGKNIATTPYKPDVTKAGLSSTAKTGINLGMAAVGEGGKYLLSNGFNTTVGNVLDTVGNFAASIAPAFNVAWWVPGAIAAGSKLIAGAYNGAFGTETYDNGATAYTNRLRSINPNGSNEYIANLLASVGLGPRATYRDGWARNKGENEAAEINNNQDIAYEDFLRSGRNAINNNNIIQMQHALNDYGVTAMGGKLNRRKCNKKSTGGILNNSYIDTSSPSGYDIMMTALGNQEQKNQMQQDTNSSLGNSFISTPNMSTIYAKGGPMIKPENRGKLTELKKRTGKTEAELYNDGNPEHKKMVVFARNARKWKKAYGGFLDAANSLAQAEGALYSTGGKLNYDENKNIRNNSFFNDPTLFALGGTYQAAGSNWGNVSETQTSMPNKGYNVGDVIEIDESEAELLKKLGYEYKIVG